MCVCVGEQLTEFENDKVDLQDRLSAESQKCKTLSHLVHKLEIELREHVTAPVESPQSGTNQSPDKEDDYVCVSMCVCVHVCISVCVCVHVHICMNVLAFCLISSMYVRTFIHSESKALLCPSLFTFSVKGSFVRS